MKTIPGYSKYKISKEGEVFSEFVNRLITPYTNQRGYWRVMLVSDNGPSDNVLLHRLLAFVYLDLPSLDSDLEVDHVDTDINNNKLNNLQVITSEQHKQKTLSDRGYIKRLSCANCNNKLSAYNSGKLCNYCKNELIRQESTITVESIEYWVSQFSWVRAAKELGLSDNGLRKRYKILSGNDPKSIKKMAHSSNG